MSSAVDLLLGLMEYVGVGNLLTAITLCFITFWFIRTNYWASFQYRLPPGPPAIPYPFDVFMASLSPTSNRFGRLIQINRRYGDLASLQLGKKLMILISNPTIVKELIVKQADVTSNRIPPPFFKHMMGYSGGILFSDGEAWQELRRFSLSALRKFGMGRKGVETRIQEEARVLCNSMAQKSGEAFDAMHLTNAAVSNIICTITFGRRMDYDDPVFMDMILRFRRLTGAFGLNPILRELMVRFPVICKTPLVDAARENIMGVKDFINKEVEEHIKSYDSTDIRDIIDMYLAEADRLKEENSQQNKAGKTPFISKDNIWMCVFDLFFAGTETTSSSLLWFILAMARRTDVQEKVMKEMDLVIGRERAPCMDDRKNMPYTEATLTEVLRFRPVAPVGVPHVTAKDVEIQGYSIPANTEIMINIIGIHLDERLWEDAEEFKPDRFLSEDRKSVIKHDAFTLFGAGRRVCLGEQLARMELFLFATTLMQRFRFVLPENETTDFSFDHCVGTVVPKTFKVYVKER